MSISAHFNMFCDELKVSAKKESIISLRYNSINKKLNNDFWNIDTSYGGVYIGCYGRETANDGIKEVDMIFEMPSHLLKEYEECGGNFQARFLEDVRRSIVTMYPKTIIDKEKQAIKVRFSDRMCFNIFPAFIKDGGGYIFANLTDNGSWSTKKPISLIEAIKEGDKVSNHNLKKLCRMAKAWKQNCKVRIKDVLIDTLAYEFLLSSGKTYESYSHFDVMCMDFFEFLMKQESSKVIWNEIGSNQKIYNFDNFRYKAILAHLKAKNAIKLELSGKKWSSKQKWIGIFGHRFPESVKIELQIRKLCDKTIQLYDTHKICVRILNQRVMTFKGFQCLTALLIISGMLIMEYTESFDIGVGIFIVSSLMFLTTLYLKKNNLGDISVRHKESALHSFLIEEEFQALLKDLNRNDIDISIIRKRKDELQRKMINVYRGTSKYVSKGYSEATQKIDITSRIKEKLPTINSKKMRIPAWQSNKFYTRTDYSI